MQVVGITEKSGEYKDREYHNIMLHCTKESDNCHGVLTEIVKVKYADVREVFGKTMNPTDWQNLVGKKVSVNYNRYGVVTEVRIHEPK